MYLKLYLSGTQGVGLTEDCQTKARESSKLLAMESM